MSDVRRTDSIRYHRSGRDELDGLLFVDAQPYEDVDIGVTFDRSVPNDFRPKADETVVPNAPASGDFGGARRP